jgi:hypothetical protein
MKSRQGSATIVMAENTHQEQLQDSIAKALLYSDIFSYPLTAEEVYTRLPTNHTCVEEITDALGKMKRKGLVFQFGDFYAVRNEQTLESRRMAGNQRAQHILPGAFRRGRLLSKFPFVRSVMISGSLSKNYMDEDSDVDYFVITTPGRLWVTRFLIAAFKRIFLRNSHKLFCVNYYIDSNHLEIEEKNIFTATELVTLIPVTNNDEFNKFIKSNSWVSDFFPNHSRVSDETTRVFSKTSLLKRFVEACINPAGDALDNAILRMATRRYVKRYAHLFPASDFQIAFKSSKGISKNHDRHFQKHITELFCRKVERFQKDHSQSQVA